MVKLEDLHEGMLIRPTKDNLFGSECLRAQQYAVHEQHPENHPLGRTKFVDCTEGKHWLDVGAIEGVNPLWEHVT